MDMMGAMRYAALNGMISTWSANFCANQRHARTREAYHRRANGMVAERTDSKRFHNLVIAALIEVVCAIRRERWQAHPDGCWARRSVRSYAPRLSCLLPACPNPRPRAEPPSCP